MAKMTRKQALAEAQRRWGKGAYAEPSRYTGYDGTGMLKMVGIFEPLTDQRYGVVRRIDGKRYVMELYGAGETWEVAFDEATKRGH